jgi:hypothetical protein
MTMQTAKLKSSRGLKWRVCGDESQVIAISELCKVFVGVSEKQFADQTTVISGRGKGFFCSPRRPDRLWGLHSFLLNEYRVSFSEVKRPGLDVD